jgi:uncharacterized protein (TIGR03435 family)
MPTGGRASYNQFIPPGENRQTQDVEHRPIHCRHSEICMTPKPIGPVFTVGLALFCFDSWSPAQSNPAPTFEVASVKRSAPGPNGVHGGCHGVDSVYTPGQAGAAPPLGRCVIGDARLSHLVHIAWKMQTMQLIKSGPVWIAGGDERFNVEAKAENPTTVTEKQLLAMLQALLIERFQMKFHREPSELPGFALTVAKGGSKLHESKSQDEEFSSGRDQGKPALSQPVTINARRLSLQKLTDLLSSFGGRGPGIDKTGLQGVYDFTLMWDEDAGPTLDVALREQLGLRLESQKVPVAYFVIDSAQRPSAN